jgi:hypothetical protein
VNVPLSTVRHIWCNNYLPFIGSTNKRVQKTLNSGCDLNPMFKRNLLDAFNDNQSETLVNKNERNIDNDYFFKSFSMLNFEASESEKTEDL